MKIRSLLKMYTQLTKDKFQISLNLIRKEYFYFHNV